MLKAHECAFGRPCMDGGDAARMAGAPGLEQIQRLASANLADDDAVGAQAQSRTHELGHGNDAGARAQRNVVVGRALEFHRVFENDYAVAGERDLGEERIGERRLAGAGGAGDQDVASIPHRLAQARRLHLGHDAVGDVGGESDDGARALPNGEGRCAYDRRENTFEALARVRQFGGQDRRTGVHLGVDVRRDQADDAFGVGCGEREARSARVPRRVGRATTNRPD